MGGFFSLVGISLFIILISIKQINEYERGVKFTFGKYTGIMTPGWRIVIPVFQMYKNVDMRIKAVDVPDQKAITKDNVSVLVNAVIYYKVGLAEKAIIEVEDFQAVVTMDSHGNSLHKGIKEASDKIANKLIGI